MGARVLFALVALLCTYTPGCRAVGCSAFKHLENGQTFFRYGGLLVIFRCRPGYKLHGYKTNSCVSGHWSRDTPVCVGSGCSHPGPIAHGTSSMNEHGSWAVFSCNSGFRRHGPSMLYCKGNNWNSTKPVCKEFDMMSSVSGDTMPKSTMDQNLQAAVALKTEQQDTLDNSASKDANLKFGFTSQISNSERIKVTNPKVHLQQHIQFPNFKVKDRVQTAHHEAQPQETIDAQAPETRTGSELKASAEEAANVDNVIQMLPSKSHRSTMASPTLSSLSGTEQSTSSPSSSSPAATALPTVLFAPTTRLHTESVLPVLSSEKALVFEEPVTYQDYVTPSVEETGSFQSGDEDQQAESGFLYPALSQPESAEKDEPTETSAIYSSLSDYIVSTTSSPPSSALSTPPPSFSTSTSSPSSIQPSMTTQLLGDTTARPGLHWTELHDITMNSTSKPPLLHVNLSGRPVCPYPPVPAHGTFYFRNVENPGPTEYRHYIQYACYPGYTLAHGDMHSYCQQGGSWSGTTPVCLELTPCSVNNGGCSQLCSHSQHHNQSSNQTQTRTRCLCRPGFTLLDDGRTCRDLDECVEGLHQCQQRCVNTFGSFKCSCDDGFQITHDQTSCTDVDECLQPAAVTGCLFGCVNTPGSFHCLCPPGYSLQSSDGHCEDVDECAANRGLGPCMEQCHNSPGSYHCSCTYGHILAGDGHSCIAECPPGYRKQPTTPPENSTAQALTDECIDINECQEGKCEWQCVNLPGSHRCICPRGYTLHRDGQRCKDINECSKNNGGCSHLCVNQKGGHKCACPATHRLSPYSWRKCLPRTTANTAG